MRSFIPKFWISYCRVGTLTFDPKMIAIRCVGHNAKRVVSEAILEGWKTCARCSLFICPQCVRIFREENNNLCPSYHVGYPSHQMQLENIALEELLLFVRKHAQPEIGTLIHEVFYHPETPIPRLSEEFVLPLSETDADTHPATIKEEIWRKYGVVIVKRKRGKFVTWEKLQSSVEGALQPRPAEGDSRNA